MSLCMHCHKPMPCSCPSGGEAPPAGTVVEYEATPGWLILDGLGEPILDENGKPTIIRTPLELPGRTIYEAQCPECPEIIRLSIEGSGPPRLAHRAPVCPTFKAGTVPGGKYGAEFAEKMRLALEPKIPAELIASHSPWQIERRARERRRRYRWR